MKKLVDLINECVNDDEIKEVIDIYVDMYNNLSYDLNPISSVMKVIGRDLDINPDGNSKIYTNNKWLGFIPNDVKIVYCTLTNSKGSHNKGCYYYLNDRKYLYEFAKYIKGKDIPDENIFLAFVYMFMNDYYKNTFEPLDREVVDGLILDIHGEYYPPVKEHDISDFKNNGSAKCSEYAVMAQNIMSIFGYKVLIVFDELHAYNIFYYSKDEAYVLDFQSGLKFYDINLNFVREIPYVAKIEHYDDNLLYDVLYNGGKIEFDDVFFVEFKDEIIPFFEGGKRIYGADGVKIKRKF